MFQEVTQHGADNVQLGQLAGHKVIIHSLFYLKSNYFILCLQVLPTVPPDSYTRYHFTPNTNTHYCEFLKEYTVLDPEGQTEFIS